MSDLRFVSDCRCYKCDQPNGSGKRELRPYGPNGQPVCFECATATPEADAATGEAFGKLLDQTSRHTGAAMLTPEGPIPFVGKVPGVSYE